eukprot:g24590.t1
MLYRVAVTAAWLGISGLADARQAESMTSLGRTRVYQEDGMNNNNQKQNGDGMNGEMNEGEGEMNEGEMNDGMGKESAYDSTNYTQGNAQAIYMPKESYNKIFMIWFENHGLQAVKENEVWASILQDAYLLTNHFGVTYPSQPNYCAFMAGQSTNVTNDDQQYLDWENLVDKLEHRGKSWKGYMENYYPNEDGSCNMAANIDYLYFRKHNPFFPFTNIYYDNERCKNIVDEYQFYEDVMKDDLPNFAFYTPNIDNGAHDQDLDYAGTFLQNLLEQWVKNYPSSWDDVLIIVTFEADDRSENQNVPLFFMANNNKYLTTAGDDSERNPQMTNHYALTKFVLENFGCSYLGKYESTANALWLPFDGDNSFEIFKKVATAVSGSCEAGPEDASECIEAAYKGLKQDLKVGVTSSSAIPKGCYYNTVSGQLYFNSYTGKSVDCNSNRKCLCYDLANSIYVYKYGAQIDYSAQSNSSDSSSGQDEGSTAVEQFEVQTSSNCGSPVTSANECARAASNMGLASYAVPSSSLSVPAGCYYHPSTDTMFFNVNSDSTKSCSSDRKCICLKWNSSSEAAIADLILRVRVVEVILERN